MDSSLLSFLREEIDKELNLYPDLERQIYIEGLEHALELAEKINDSELKVGCRYFVIMYKEENKRIPYVQEMLLYKKTETMFGEYHYFSSNLNICVKNRKPDFKTSNQAIIDKRVFKTVNEAMKGIKKWQ